MRDAGGVWFGPEWTCSQELHHLGDYRHRINQTMPEHRTDFHEIVLVARGSLHLRVDGHPLAVRGGMIAAIPNGTRKALDGGLSRGRYLWIGIGDERHRRPDRAAQLDEAERQDLALRLQVLARRPAPAPPDLLPACEALLRACAGPARPVVRRAAALRILAALLSGGGDAAVDDGALAPALALVARDPVAAAARSLPDLAAMCGLGLTTFKRRWLAQTGLSPGDDIARRRLALAAPRLAAGARVGAVARALGYASPAAFSAAWRRLHGRPPRGR